MTSSLIVRDKMYFEKWLLVTNRNYIQHIINNSKIIMNTNTFVTNIINTKNNVTKKIKTNK